MPFCKKCGSFVEEEAHFCEVCGEPRTKKSGSDKRSERKADIVDKTQIRGKMPLYGAVSFDSIPEGYVIAERYEIIEKIGQGGFGAVYRCFDRNMDTEKALKIIPEVVSSDKEAMFDLQQEARTMIALNHPNVVRVYDFHQSGAIKFIDMEFLDGKNLSEVKLEFSDKRIPEARVKEYALKIAEGMSYAHSKRVLHKDLKSHNVKVTSDGSVKIMDFGIAETVRTSMSRLEQGSSSGTLVYMSPEQLRGRDIGKEADVYSYGALLYELLSGQPPFCRGDIQYQIINEKPKPIEHISAEMNNFLVKCLEKDYKNRYRNFDEVISYWSGSVVIPKNISESPVKPADSKPDTPSDEESMSVGLSTTPDNAEKHSEEIENSIDEFDRKKKNKRLISLISLSIAIPLIAIVVFLMINSNAKQEKAWNMAQKTDTIQSYQEYLANYPKGRYAKIANDAIDEKVWEKAKEIDTVESYKDYLTNYTDGGHAKDASNAIQEKAWDMARRTDTIQSYQEYLANYPDGKHAKDASNAIQEKAWNIAQKTNTIQSYQEYLANYPKGRYANEASKKVSILEKMVYVKGGTFTMGDTRGDEHSDELPTHRVTLNSFYIGRYLVTQREYEDVMGSNPARDYGVGVNYPVYNVSWYSAIKFCNLLSMKESLTPVYSINGSTNPANWGSVPTSNNSTWDAAVCNWNANGYRLPTEAEWEYAARGRRNTPDYLYSGSDNIDDVAWFFGNNSPDNDGTKPIGGKQPNGLEIYDMSGNLWEWCWDWYDSSFYKNSPLTNPKGPSSGSDRLRRGGYWYYNAANCRVAYRNYNSPYSSNNRIGFRLCRAIP